jgi:hypothetical protein
MSGILYTRERTSVGVVVIPLDRVRGATKLKMVRGEHVEEYDFTGRNPGTVIPLRIGGDPVITLQVEGQDDYLVADWPGAIAVTVTDPLYWLKHGRWYQNPDEDERVARSLIEVRYVPEGYGLPTDGAVNR